MPQLLRSMSEIKITALDGRPASFDDELDSRPLLGD